MFANVYFGDNESNSRFNGSFYESAIYAPRSEKIVATAEPALLAMSLPQTALKRYSPSSFPTKATDGNVTPPML